MQALVCPACEKGNLRASTYSDSFAHRGGRVFVEGMSCFACDSCEEITIDGDQARSNQQLIAVAKRTATEAECEIGSLLPQQIKSIRDRLGFSQALAAKVFGGGRHAFSKYERGVTRPDSSMELLLRVASDVPEALAYIRALAGEPAERAPLWANAPDVWHAANSTPYISVDFDFGERATGNWQNETGYLFQRAS